MKKFFGITIFWLIVLIGFLAYLKWFNQNLAMTLTSYIVKQEVVTPVCPSDVANITEITTTGTTFSGVQSTITTETPDIVTTKLEEIQKSLKEINEKLDIQNSNSPDAVSVSLRTTKKTNIWIFPLNGSEYTKHVMPASDDILRDTLTLLFDKSPFSLKDTRLDNDGNLTLTLERIPGTSFGGAAAVEQTKTAIEKTALQFSQIKKVVILPEEVLQP